MSLWLAFGLGVVVGIGLGASAGLFMVWVSP